MATEEPLHVSFRVIAPFPQLVRRAYLRLLLSGGPKVAAYGAMHGVHDVGDLRRLVAQIRARPPEAWEVA
ncbi:MAG: hypothetical protein ACYSX0_22255 [Planctomycetota bacterium]